MIPTSVIKELRTNQNKTHKPYVMPYAIWYHLHNLKKVKNTHRGVLILIKLQAEAYTLLRLTLLHGCFSRFLNCANGTKSRNASHLFLVQFSAILFCTPPSFTSMQRRI